MLVDVTLLHLTMQSIIQLEIIWRIHIHTMRNRKNNFLHQIDDTQSAAVDKQYALADKGKED